MKMRKTSGLAGKALSMKRRVRVKKALGSARK
jgi:hypothetical protein